MPGLENPLGAEMTPDIQAQAVPAARQDASSRVSAAAARWECDRVYVALTAQGLCGLRAWAPTASPGGFYFPDPLPRQCH